MGEGEGDRERWVGWGMVIAAGNEGEWDGVETERDKGWVRKR